MLKIKIADFKIAIDNKYSYIEKLCEDYVYDGEDIDFTISCTDLQITEEEERMESIGQTHTPAYREAICVYREICMRLPQLDAFVMHGAVIEVDGMAYAFCAKSGTGKSTHIALWKKLLGDKVQIVNGDKPIIRKIDGVFYAYGTPWCGKEFWHRNVSRPLKAICFVERDLKNRIDKISTQESAERIMKQVLIPTDPMGAIKTFELLDEMLYAVDSWLLGCNISIEAAEIAYKAMSGGKNEN